MGERDSGPRQLRGDAERIRPEPGQDDTGMGARRAVNDQPAKTCIYPGCDRPAASPHLLGGPQPSFCELEEHNALTAHQERQRLADQAIRDPGDSER